MKICVRKRYIFFSYTLPLIAWSLFLMSQAWALGDHQPKTPLEQARQKINILKVVSVTSFFTRVSIPIPNFLRQPVETEEQGATIYIEVRKIGFEKFILSGVQTPTEMDGHPAFIAGMEYGKIVVSLKIRVRYLGSNIPFDGNVIVEPAFLPVNIHALQNTTRFEVTPPDRRHEVFVGRVSLDFNRFPKFIDQYISRMFREQITQGIMESIPHTLLDIPDIPPLLQ